jgi:hypothetical protein
MRIPFRRVSAAAAPAPAPVAGSVDVGTVRQRFNWDWATSDDTQVTDGDGNLVDTYWWWAISIRVDPNEVIAEDDEGNLWSVPFTTDGEDQVTFGEPMRVRETYIPVAAADGVAATAVVSRRRQRVLAAALERPTKPGRESGPDSNPAAAAATTQEEETTVMDVDTTLLRRRLGLPEDATEDQIAEALAAPVEPEEPAAPEAETETEPVAAPAAAPEPVAAADGTVTLDQETYQRLVRTADTVEQLAATQATEARERAVDAAIADGRIAPSRRDHWLGQLAADPGAQQVLASLAAGTIPVTERGGTPAPGADDKGLDAVRASMGLTSTRKAA